MAIYFILAAHYTVTTAYNALQIMDVSTSAHAVFIVNLVVYLSACTDKEETMHFGTHHYIDNGQGHDDDLAR